MSGNEGNVEENEKIDNGQSNANMVSRLLSDPLAAFLIERSLLSKKQIETLLIELMSEREGNYDAKGAVRGVSRGAFKRTLQQAVDKVLGAIYTVLLMAYLGALSRIISLIEIGQNIEEYRNMVENEVDPNLRKELAIALRNSLEKLEEYWKA